ncbi:hypothetical protein GG804_25170 [Sphingomonas histidinilytica]|uniref:hypothetical protein n=1 Tax=Rhizorhabdus histidinilytica TaxID=439228 RepID=UPI001ADAC256|nr:hypothetical protein [Rhizorhabdus histidinilytica]MBO9380064.1 hypothetical protein [Rhizorhabdus histidinilytica]
METVAGKLYEDVVVQLDGRTFIDCVFKAATLNYAGGLFHMSGCDFIDCTWNFDGSAANTVQVLRLLSVQPGGDKIIRDMFPMLGKPRKPPTRR